jgi:hypothetical protein
LFSPLYVFGGIARLRIAIPARGTPDKSPCLIANLSRRLYSGPNALASNYSKSVTGWDCNF